MVLTQRLLLDILGEILTIEHDMNELNKHEEEALHEVLTDITDSSDEIGQNRAIDRYLKLNMAVAIRNGTLSSEMFDKALDALKPKQKIHGNN